MTLRPARPLAGRSRSAAAAGLAQSMRRVSSTWRTPIGIDAARVSPVGVERRTDDRPGRRAAMTPS